MELTQPARRVAIATITVSDSRNETSDSSGALLRQLIEEEGYALGPHMIVRDEIELIQTALRGMLCSPEIDSIVLTGGTGIGPRDVTVEAIEPMLERKLDGFGEAFRRLSWEQVGARAVLSRATGGVIKGRIVFLLPGSPGAVALGMERLIGPLLRHALHMLAGTGHETDAHHRDS